MNQKNFSLSSDCSSMLPFYHIFRVSIQMTCVIIIFIARTLCTPENEHGIRITKRKKKRKIGRSNTNEATVCWNWVRMLESIRSFQVYHKYFCLFITKENLVTFGRVLLLTTAFFIYTIYINVYV